MSQTKAQLVSGTTAQDLTVDNINTTSINSGQASGRKNLIINGAVQVWQRGTSTTSSGTYQADRFWVVNQGTYARDNSAPDGFQYSVKLTHSSSDMAIGTPIELPATGNASPLVATNKFTVSFYGKADSGTEDVNLLCRYRNSKFSSTNQVDFTGTGQTFTLTTSWQRFTKTFTIPTVNANNTIISIEVDGIGATAYFTGFQAELGSTATDFEHRSFGQELDLCQRYYFVYMPSGRNNANLGVGGYTGGGNQFELGVRFPKPMRAAPSLEQSTGTDYFAVYLHNTTETFDSFAADQLQPESTGIITSSAGSHGGKVGRARINNASASIAFSAEL